MVGGPVIIMDMVEPPGYSRPNYQSDANGDDQLEQRCGSSQVPIYANLVGRYTRLKRSGMAKKDRYRRVGIVAGKDGWKGLQTAFGLSDSGDRRSWLC